MIERTLATELAATSLSHGRYQATIHHANIHHANIQETRLA